MKISIIVPTFNNLNYLNFFLSSLKKNSLYDHQIILHINDGSDGTLNYAKQNGGQYYPFTTVHQRFYGVTSA